MVACLKGQWLRWMQQQEQLPKDEAGEPWYHREASPKASQPGVLLLQQAPVRGLNPCCHLQGRKDNTCVPKATAR